MTRADLWNEMWPVTGGVDAQCEVRVQDEVTACAHAESPTAVYLSQYNCVFMSELSNTSINTADCATISTIMSRTNEIVHRTDVSFFVFECFLFKQEVCKTHQRTDLLQGTSVVALHF